MRKICIFIMHSLFSEICGDFIKCVCWTSFLFIDYWDRIEYITVIRYIANCISGRNLSIQYIFCYNIKIFWNIDCHWTMSLIKLKVLLVLFVALSEWRFIMTVSKHAFLISLLFKSNCSVYILRIIVQFLHWCKNNLNDSSRSEAKIFYAVISR